MSLLQRSVARSAQQQLRSLSTAADFMAEKRAAKERRRAAFVERQERPRRQRPKVVNPFKKWFIQRKVHDEYHDRKARQAGLPWKHRVAVILERTNVVLPDRPEWEEQYDNLRAYLNQFGKEYPSQFQRPLPENLVYTHEELLEMLPFTPAPRETEADHSGDVRTLDRRLKTSVFLMVQEGDKWQLPTVELNEDETILEAAERVLKDRVGSSIKYWAPSNCPMAVELQHEETKDSYGFKTFFMRVNYSEGAISESLFKLQDYAWLDASEIEERMSGDPMFYRYVL